MSLADCIASNSSSRILHATRYRRERRGAIIVLTAVLLVVVLAIVAFAVDVGVMMMTRTEIQRGVDSGALAAAGILAAGNEDPVAVARQYVIDNSLYGTNISAEDIDVELGDWDEATRRFIPANNRDHITAVRVLARAQDRPLFFGFFAGQSLFDTEAESIATFQPRDIVLVMDCSGSMNDDSEFQKMDQLGRQQIEDNQYQIYQELGSPRFGNMSWNPRYISTTNDNRLLRDLGLRRVPYPYARGSWEDYFDYVQSNYNVRRAGYQKEYGYLTFIQYLLEQREAYSDTPVLWQTSEQPITAVKNAVSILLAYIESVKADDRVGLSVYTHPNGGALLTEELTYNLEAVEDATRGLQAGHYESLTNIYAGLREAREEMEANSRPGALKLIVLLTDGQANQPSNNPEGRLLQEARECARRGFVVLTISLGAGADQDLMQEVADITGGIHFNIPGGQPVADYQEQLEDVFRQIASQRPLRLVD